MVAEASVFVLPCVRVRDGAMDGIPVSLMEAMALKVPVVSTRLSGIPELVRDGETGLLIPPRDPVALADAIETLLNDSALAGRLAENAHRLVSEEFDLRKNARRLAELIEQHTSLRAGGRGRMPGVLLFSGCYEPPFDEGVKLVVHHLREEMDAWGL